MYTLYCEHYANNACITDRHHFCCTLRRSFRREKLERFSLTCRQYKHKLFVHAFNAFRNTMIRSSVWLLLFHFDTCITSVRLNLSAACLNLWENDRRIVYNERFVSKPAFFFFIFRTSRLGGGLIYFWKIQICLKLYCHTFCWFH